MHKHTKRKIAFAGKSLVWATLLFSAAMLLLNWGEMRNGVNGRYVIISNAQDSIIRRIDPSGLQPLQDLVSKTHTFLKSISAAKLPIQ